MGFKWRNRSSAILLLVHNYFYVDCTVLVDTGNGLRAVVEGTPSPASRIWFLQVDTNLRDFAK